MSVKPRFVRAEPAPGLFFWYCDDRAVQVPTPERILAWVTMWHGRGATPAEAYSAYLTRQIARAMAPVGLAT